jgi:signal transduction histidine kinase
VIAPSDVAPRSTFAGPRGAWSTLLDVATLAVLIGSFVAERHPPHAALWIVADLVILVWAAAALVTSRFNARLAWLLSSGTFAAALAAAAARIAEVHDRGVHSSAQVVAVIAGALAMAVSIQVLLALPSGELTSRSRRTAALWWYLVALGVGALVASTTRVFPPWPMTLGWAVVVVLSLPGVYSRYTSASAAGRQRLQCLAVGLALSLVITVVTLVLNWLVNWPSPDGGTLLAGSALLPLGLLVGNFSFTARADRFLVHLLPVLGLTIVVVGAYVIALRGLGHAPQNRTEREMLGWSMAAAAIAAVVYFALKGRFERLATSLTYGAREAPDEVVRTFGTRLTRAIPMDELLLQLAESLRKTLTLSSAEIYIGTGEVLELAASVPDIPQRSLIVSGDERAVVARAGVSGNAWASVWIPGIVADRPSGPLRVAPISHAGELLGIIVITRGEGAVGFRDEDDRVLTDLARQVGLAIHNAQLDTALQSSLDELRRQADELRASRARVVASGDAERRRVERNLHDGAQQHLVALAINLRLAKDVVGEDPAAAIEMLDELGVAVQDTIKELRELAHGIYPPLLVDSGLPEALRAVANRSPLDVDLVTDGIGRYGRDVEAAIYFCVLEALQNAGKHAPDSHVTIRIWEELGGLLFEVADDGPGFDPSVARSGHGYVNMADRLGAIGGAVRWESEIGEGTTIRGSVPLSS